MKKKRIAVKSGSTTYSRLVTKILSEEDNLNEQMLDLADAILSNCPVLVVFTNVKNTAECNRVLSFLMGVIYSIDGESYKTSDESYLIASKKAFEDGSLKRWMRESTNADVD